MTYISTLERKAQAEGQEIGQQIGEEIGQQRGLQEGLLVGIEVGLKLKFGDAGLALLPAIQQITDPDVLATLLNTLAECDSLADFNDAIPHA